ncbi:branched-chain amino acid aminotransferase [Aeromicrobium wangtongii]|uniref:Branched-chain-amino-acid aminotransferase n=1 Tax=Aeromicrobium wangtongii TaxID=2969247 RepID=A0ABY5M665_9ACTN|nr:branched-chain amino acid aminotransferase [Aeromicrobium wangtongii]MCD9198535.1 branched-chain amino acid aminotransferase [Aeromicrobium wangtongii]UUP12561.1 branched-chain amino acid aminotransferase [Aeromicrobium wangtongii]
MTSTPFAATVSRNPAAKTPEQRDAILADPGFGNHFTDHMFLAEWTPDTGWANGRVVPYGPLSIDPATAVLHYAQEIFEGLKAYVHADGSVWLFRPEANAARLQRSAHRLALPELPTDWFLGSVTALVDADRDWVPSGGEKSLYLRPFMFASEVFLGVRPSQHVTYSVIASPAGAYFKGGVKPVSIWLSSQYSRAGTGGTGAAKCGGNYAASLLPQQEGMEHGCEQVVFLDSTEHTWIEELGGMNLYFVHSDGSIVTPTLSGSILEGITRDSIIQVARDLGHEVVERRVSIQEWREGVADGSITEVFACGTAAVITPVGTLKWDGGEVTSGDGEAGKVTSDIRSALIDIQYGRAEDRHGWLTRVS